MALRRREFTKFLRRTIPEVVTVEWTTRGSSHWFVTVTTTSGKVASIAVPGSATDMRRRRLNLITELKRRLEGLQ